MSASLGWGPSAQGKPEDWEWRAGGQLVVMAKAAEDLLGARPVLSIGRL